MIFSLNNLNNIKTQLVNNIENQNIIDFTNILLVKFVILPTVSFD